MPFRVRATFPLLLCACVAAGGCIPYTVGSTAVPTAPCETDITASMFFLPAGVELRDSSASLPIYSIDIEGRFGVSARADVGFRFTSLSGAVVTYKRLLREPYGDRDWAAAWMVGGGVVNAGLHAHVEGSLLVSGAERGPLTPYGGLRVMQVVPINDDAVSDTPTAGAFVGFRIGSRDLGVSPEVSVFWDRSALGVRDSEFIAVLSVSLHGERLLRLLSFGR